jgi:SSS family solute:Na+ symporter
VVGIRRRAGLLVLAHVLVPMYYKYKCTTTTELLGTTLGDPRPAARGVLLFLLGLHVHPAADGAVHRRALHAVDVPA